MKVTIITSCYNREATIRDAIRSVLAQDYPDIEYIIVDGASTDRSLEIIKSELPSSPLQLPQGGEPQTGCCDDISSIIVNDDKTDGEPQTGCCDETSTLGGIEGDFKVISEPDHGMYEAINKGIRAATGDVIGLLHSDDFLYDNHVVSRIVERMEETGADFLYGNGLFVNAENTDKVVRKWIGGTYRIWKVRHGWLPLHPTCYIRREAIERRGLYNETYKIAADSDFLLRYLLGGDLAVAYLNEFIVRMRMGGLSTDSKRRKQMWDEDIQMFRSHGFHPTVTKIEKMLWKVPQFVKAKFM